MDSLHSRNQREKSGAMFSNLITPDSNTQHLSPQRRHWDPGMQIMWISWQITKKSWYEANTREVVMCVLNLVVLGSLGVCHLRFGAWAHQWCSSALFVMAGGSKIFWESPIDCVNWCHLWVFWSMSCLKVLWRSHWNGVLVPDGFSRPWKIHWKPPFINLYTPWWMTNCASEVQLAAYWFRQSPAGLGGRLQIALNAISSI